MRTNIEIEDSLMDAAMRAGPYRTKKEVVEAGLQLVTRQAAYRDILRWEGKLHWNDSDNAQALDLRHSKHEVNEPTAVLGASASRRGGKRNT